MVLKGAVSSKISELHVDLKTRGHDESSVEVYMRHESTVE